jgi:hypothetical protein
VDLVPLRGGDDPDPGEATLPRDRELPPRVRFRLLELRRDVLEHGLQVGVVEPLEVTEVEHLLRQPVGDDEEAATARVPVGEQRLQLAEELEVVVDVLDVVDFDGVGLLELGDGAVLSGVDVAGPVGDRHLAGWLPTLGDRRFGAAAAAVVAAGGQRQRGDQDRHGHQRPRPTPHMALLA